MTISEKELIKLISKNIKEKPENININSKRSEFKNVNFGIKNRGRGYWIGSI